MPVYNGEKYLESSVSSILNQSCSDFELLLIDDGSTDNSLKILKKFEEQDDRVRVITRANRGLSNTLNEMIDLARGRWFARMDMDDIALPRRFELQLKWLENTGADICGTWAKCFGGSDNRIIRHGITDESIKLELLFGCAFVHPSVLIRSEAIKSLRYDPALDSAEDYDLWVRAARAGLKLANIPEVLLMYRVHDSQFSSVASSLQKDLSQRVRKTYWKFLSSSIQCSDNEIEMILKLRESVVSHIDLSLIDSGFTKVLQKTSTESFPLIFDHISRLYYRAAACSIFTPFHWRSLSKNFQSKYDFKIYINLIFLAIFKLAPDSFLFHFLKKTHLSMRIKKNSSDGR